MKLRNQIKIYIIITFKINKQTKRNSVVPQLQPQMLNNFLQLQIPPTITSCNSDSQISETQHLKSPSGSEQVPLYSQFQKAFSKNSKEKLLVLKSNGNNQEESKDKNYKNIDIQNNQQHMHSVTEEDKFFSQRDDLFSKSSTSSWNSLNERASDENKDEESSENISSVQVDVENEEEKFVVNYIPPSLVGLEDGAKLSHTIEEWKLNKALNESKSLFWRENDENSDINRMEEVKFITPPDSTISSNDQQAELGQGGLTIVNTYYVIPYLKDFIERRK